MRGLGFTSLLHLIFFLINLSETTPIHSGDLVLSHLCLEKHGDFVAHPLDCSQFIRCSHSRAYVFQCPSNLRWNQAIKICDWPANVECDVLVGGKVEEMDSGKHKKKSVKRDVRGQSTMNVQSKYANSVAALKTKRSSSTAAREAVTIANQQHFSISTTEKSIAKLPCVQKYVKNNSSNSNSVNKITETVWPKDSTKPLTTVESDSLKYTRPMSYSSQINYSPKAAPSKETTSTVRRIIEEGISTTTITFSDITQEQSLDTAKLGIQLTSTTSIISDASKNIHHELPLVHGKVAPTIPPKDMANYNTSDFSQMQNKTEEEKYFTIKSEFLNGMTIKTNGKYKSELTTLETEMSSRLLSDTTTASVTVTSPINITEEDLTELTNDSTEGSDDNHMTVSAAVAQTKQPVTLTNENIKSMSTDTVNVTEYVEKLTEPLNNLQYKNKSNENLHADLKGINKNNNIDGVPSETFNKSLTINMNNSDPEYTEAVTATITKIELIQNSIDPVQAVSDSYLPYASSTANIGIADVATTLEVRKTKRPQIFTEPMTLSQSPQSLENLFLTNSWKNDNKETIESSTRASNTESTNLTESITITAQRFTVESLTYDHGNVTPLTVDNLADELLTVESSTYDHGNVTPLTDDDSLTVDDLADELLTVESLTYDHGNVTPLTVGDSAGELLTQNNVEQGMANSVNLIHQNNVTHDSLTGNEPSSHILNTTITTVEQSAMATESTTFADSFIYDDSTNESLSETMLISQNDREVGTNVLESITQTASKTFMDSFLDIDDNVTMLTTNDSPEALLSQTELLSHNELLSQNEKSHSTLDIEEATTVLESTTATASTTLRDTTDIQHISDNVTKFTDYNLTDELLSQTDLKSENELSSHNEISHTFYAEGAKTITESTMALESTTVGNSAFDVTTVDYLKDELSSQNELLSQNEKSHTTMDTEAVTTVTDSTTERKSITFRESFLHTDDNVITSTADYVTDELLSQSEVILQNEKSQTLDHKGATTVAESITTIASTSFMESIFDVDDNVTILTAVDSTDEILSQTELSPHIEQLSQNEKSHTTMDTEAVTTVTDSTTERKSITFRESFFHTDNNVTTLPTDYLTDELISQTELLSQNEKSHTALNREAATSATESTTAVETITFINSFLYENYRFTTLAADILSAQQPVKNFLHILAEDEPTDFVTSHTLPTTYFEPLASFSQGDSNQTSNKHVTISHETDANHTINPATTTSTQATLIEKLNSQGLNSETSIFPTITTQDRLSAILTSTDSIIEEKIDITSTSNDIEPNVTRVPSTTSHESELLPSGAKLESSSENSKNPVSITTTAQSPDDDDNDTYYGYFSNNSTTMDPRLPFRSSKCRGANNNRQFQAAACSQYYQCFAGWAFLLNCHDGYQFVKQDAKCIEDIKQECSQ